LRRRERFTAADVERVEVDVDRITPTVLIYDRPSSGLEGKFSMPFCAAAAIADGAVGIDTFERARIVDADLAAIMSRVTMRVDPTLDPSAEPLTQARVTITLTDGRVLRQDANGARGYPQRPASDEELGAKFLGCARRVLPADIAERALDVLRDIEHVTDIRDLTKVL
jgi:2-methylcitrate dehydratase PrpD